MSRPDNGFRLTATSYLESLETMDSLLKMSNEDSTTAAISQVDDVVADV